MTNKIGVTKVEKTELMSPRSFPKKAAKSGFNSLATESMPLAIEFFSEKKKGTSRQIIITVEYML